MFDCRCLGSAHRALTVLSVVANILVDTVGVGLVIIMVIIVSEIETVYIVL